MSRLVLALLLAGTLLAGVLLASEGDGNYAAERTQQVQMQEAERTARQAIIEAERTERQRIDAELLQWQMAQEAQTMRQFSMVFLAVVLTGATAGVIIAIARRTTPEPRQPVLLAPPSYIVVLAQQLPEYQPEFINGQWMLGNEREIVTPVAAHRMIADKARKV